MKSPASTLGAGSVQRRPLLVVEQSGEVGLRRAEVNSAQGQRVASVPVGKQAEVPNLHETGGQDVEILTSLQPLGTDYTRRFARLLDPVNGRF